MSTYTLPLEGITKQVDYLDQRLAQVETDMISPIEFGKLMAENESVRRDLDSLVKSVDKLATEVSAIKNTLTEAKGGWKALMFVGGAGAALGGAVSQILSHVKFT